jgi:hypothetical protein
MNWDKAVQKMGEVLIGTFKSNASIIIRPKGGRPRPVAAIIDWEPPVEVSDKFNMQVGQTIVHVLNHPFRGVTPREFDPGNWQVQMPRVRGGKSETREMTKLLSHDAGEVVVLVS